MNTPRTDAAFNAYCSPPYAMSITGLESVMAGLETELQTVAEDRDKLRADVTNLLDDLQSAVIADHPEANRALADVITDAIAKFDRDHNDLMP